MQLHLALPGLLWPARALPDLVFDLDLPALSWLLGRARTTVAPPLEFEDWLAHRLGFAAADAVPAAALRLLGAGGEPGATDWICADPAHLAFEHGRPLLGDPALLDLQDDEIEEITVALAPTFRDVGRYFLQPPGHGYIELKAPAAIRAAPPAAAALLPDGPDATRWIRLANEAQITLHGLACNRRREAAGRPRVNTLWFWGAGHLPPAPTPAYTKVGGGDTVARGLARHAGLAWQPGGGAFGRAERPLLIDDRLRAPARRRDAGAWREALRELDRERLAPLAAALRRGRIRRLVISAPGDEATLDLALDRLDALRVWRRPRPLPDLATLIEGGPA